MFINNKYIEKIWEKKKMNKISKCLIIAGVSTIILSILRWFILWYDPSQAVLGVAIGIIIIGFGDIYNARKVMEERISAVDKRIEGSGTDWAAAKFLLSDWPMMQAIGCSVSVVA